MNMANQPKTKWTLPVLEDGLIEFPDDLTEVLGWQVGDELIWQAHEDGTFTLTKVEDTE